MKPASGTIDRQTRINHMQILNRTLLIQRAFSTTGRAVVVTGMMVVIGIIFWYFSAIRF